MASLRSIRRAPKTVTSLVGGFVLFSMLASCAVAQGLPVRWNQPHGALGAVGIQAAVAVDDMNGDGVDDIALTLRFPVFSERRGFEVRSGSDGTLIASFYSSDAADGWGAAGQELVAVGDLDGDGKRDIATRDEPFSGADALQFWSTSTGQLISTAPLPGGDSFVPYGLMSIPDRNGDGQDELLATAFGGTPFTPAGATHSKLHVIDPVSGSVLQSYVAPEALGFIASSYGGGELISDLNGDGIAEIALEVINSDPTNQLLTQPSILRIIDGMSLQPLSDVSLDPTLDYWGLLDATEDVNGDGRIDLVIREHFAANPGRTLVIDPSTGSIVMTVPFLGSKYEHAVVGLGDVDADGVGDLGVFQNPHASFSWPAGQPDTFVYSSQLGLRQSSWITNGGFGRINGMQRFQDVNGDGFSEILVGDENGVALISIGGAAGYPVAAPGVAPLSVAPPFRLAFDRDDTAVTFGGHFKITGGTPNAVVLGAVSLAPRNVLLGSLRLLISDHPSDLLAAGFISLDAAGSASIPVDLKFDSPHDRPLYYQVFEAGLTQIRSTNGLEVIPYGDPFQVYGTKPRYVPTTGDVTVIGAGFDAVSSLTINGTAVATAGGHANALSFTPLGAFPYDSALEVEDATGRKDTLLFNPYPQIEDFRTFDGSMNTSVYLGGGPFPPGATMTIGGLTASFVSSDFSATVPFSQSLGAGPHVASIFLPNGPGGGGATLNVVLSQATGGE